MKKIFTLTLLAFMLVSGANAQQVHGFAMLAKAGYYSLAPASSLNKIAPANYGQQSNIFFTIGTEGYYRSNKMLMGVDGIIAFQNARSNRTDEVNFSADAVLARFGYIITEGKNGWIYPSIGTGMAMIAMNFYDRKNDATQTLQTYTNVNPLIDLGLNADLVFKRNSDVQGFSALISGLKLGYRFSIKNKTWRDVYGNKIIGMPVYHQNGFYITASMGCGAFINGKIFGKTE